MRLLLCFPGPLYSTIDLANGYARAFKKLPDIKLFTYHMEKCLAYHEFAQKFMFAKEFNENNVMLEAARDIYKPLVENNIDVALFISGIGFPAVTWDAVSRFRQKLTKPFKTGVILTESPYVDEMETEILKRVDFAFTTDYGIIDQYLEVNKNLYYLKHAYDESVHFRASDPRTIDVFMVGTGYPERQRLLQEVNWDGIDLELYGNWMYMGDSALQKYLRGSNLKNEETAQKYRESKIALNIFRTVEWPDANPKFIEPDSAKSLSPRIYEAMACGACLFTDWREELETLPKDSYVLWGDAKDLEDKLKYYLSHDEERERIAENGHRAIQGETFGKRTHEILEKINGINHLH